jgi:hypothetical protein
MSCQAPRVSCHSSEATFSMLTVGQWIFATSVVGELGMLIGTVSMISLQQQ